MYDLSGRLMSRNPTFPGTVRTVVFMLSVMAVIVALHLLQRERERYGSGGTIVFFTRVVFQANFAEDREIGDPAEISSILDPLGQSGAHLIEQAQTPENKVRLREQTQRAKELGIFGAPSFVVGEELFWGNDRLEDALAWADFRTGEARR